MIFQRKSSFFPLQSSSLIHLLFCCRKLKDVLISISEQVVKTTRDELAKYDKAKVIIDNEQNIKEAIRAIGEHHVIEHAVFKLLCKWARLFLMMKILSILFSPTLHLLCPSSVGPSNQWFIIIECRHTEWIKYRYE